MPGDSPNPETSVSVTTSAPQPNQGVAPNKPTPPQPPQGIAPNKPTPTEDVAPPEEEEEKQQQQQQPLEQLKQPSGDEKGKKKEPMLELMDELENFVAQTNKELTDLMKNVGKAGWDALQNTKPMKTINGALDEAKQFISDKVDKGLDKIYNSEAVTAARDVVNGIKDKVGSALEAIVNAPANAFAKAVHWAVSPSEKNDGPKLSEPSNTTPTEPSAMADKALGGVSSDLSTAMKSEASTPTPMETADMGKDEEIAPTRPRSP